MKKKMSSLWDSNPLLPLPMERKEFGLTNLTNLLYRYLFIYLFFIYLFIDNI